jgi:hypothetical protein
MTNKSRVLHKFSDSGISQFIFIFILLFWIAFAIFKWENNPIFFLISLIAAGFLFILIAYQTVVLREDVIEINKWRIIPFLGHYIEFEYSEIKSISFEKGDTFGEELAFRMILGRFGNAKRKLHQIHIETEADGNFDLEFTWSSKKVEKIAELIEQQVSLKR